MNSREIIKKLAQAGFKMVHQAGSHQKWKPPDGRCVIVPHPQKDYPIGTLRNIEKQAKIKF